MIASSQNETVKTMRRLRRSKGAHALLEGPHLVEEALRLGLALEPVLLTPEFAGSEAGRALVPRLGAAAKLVSSRILDSLADADAPRGLLAACRLPRPRLAELEMGPSDVWLYLDGVQDPGNLGALARVAEGLGARGLLLSSGCVDPNHSRGLRASAGSLLRLPVAVGVESVAARDRMAPLGATWIGLEAHAGAELLSGLRLARPIVLAVGAEGPGLSPAVRSAIDRSVTIPLSGRLESLNVAVAAALVLAELGRSP